MCTTVLLLKNCRGPKNQDIKFDNYTLAIAFVGYRLDLSLFSKVSGKRLLPGDLQSGPKKAQKKARQNADSVIFGLLARNAAECDGYRLDLSLFSKVSGKKLLPGDL